MIGSLLLVWFQPLEVRGEQANADPAWRKSSELAHYVADRPEGRTRFAGWP